MQYGSIRVHLYRKGYSRRSLSIMENIILWSIIAFCSPFSVSEDFVLTVTTFSSSRGQFYEAIYFLDGRVCLKVFLPKA